MTSFEFRVLKQFLLLQLSESRLQLVELISQLLVVGISLLNLKDFSFQL